MNESEQVKIFKNIIKSQNPKSDLNVLLQSIDTYNETNSFTRVLIQETCDPPIDSLFGFYRALYNPFYILVKAYAEMTQICELVIPYKIETFIDTYGERLRGVQHAIEVIANQGEPVYDEKEVDDFLSQLRSLYYWCGQQISKPKSKSKMPKFLAKIFGLKD